MLTTEQRRRLFAVPAFDRRALLTLVPAPRVFLPALLVAIVVYRLILLHGNAAPPSADAGNWLSYSRQLFGGSARASRSIYLPVLPLMVRLLLVVFPPLVALKLVGVTLSVLIGVPFWLLVRRSCGDLIAVLLTLVLVMAGYQAETLAYGAYPLILGSTLLLFSLYLLWDGLAAGNGRRLVGSAACAALAIGTHISDVFDVIVIVPVFVAAVWIQERISVERLLVRGAVWASAALLCVLPFVPFYLRTLQLLQGNPAGPQGYSISNLGSALAYVFNEQTVIWVLLASGAAVVVAFGVGIRRGDPLWPAATALLVGPALLFATLSEIRMFQLLEAGLVAALAVYVATVRRRLAERSAGAANGRLPTALAYAGLLAVAGTLVVSGHQRATRVFAYYQVVDGSGIEALNWLKAHRQPGSVLVTSDSPAYGSPTYGWWLEGYAHWPAFQATDPTWFSFKDEKAQADVANRVLTATDAAALRQLIDKYKIRYLFIDKRGSQLLGEIATLQQLGLSTAFENRWFVILQES